MSVRKYSLKFTKLSKYVPLMVADTRARMSNFIHGVSHLVSKECKTTLLVKEMDISHLMTYAEQIEEEKLIERARESKMVRVDGRGYPIKRVEVTTNFKVEKIKEAKSLPTRHKLPIVLNMEGP